MYSRKFYEAIGHVFYAVAHADNKVSPKEISELIKIVKNEWAPAEEETDEFGEDVAFQIVAVFDWLAERDVKDKEALLHFKNYIAEHPKLFTPAIKDKILKTCDKIAQVGGGKSKKENKSIQEINHILSEYSVTSS